MSPLLTKTQWVVHRWSEKGDIGNAQLIQLIERDISIFHLNSNDAGRHHWYLGRNWKGEEGRLAAWISPLDN